MDVQPLCHPPDLFHGKVRCGRVVVLVGDADDFPAVTAILPVQNVEMGYRVQARGAPRPPEVNERELVVALPPLPRLTVEVVSREIAQLPARPRAERDRRRLAHFPDP